MQMMQDEIEKHEYLKRDCDYSIIIKPGAFISEPIPFTEWQQEKIGQVKKVIESLNHLFGAFHYYYGEPGVPSDIEGLYYVAHRYGELYASLLEWIIDVRSTNASEIYNQVIQVLSELPLKVIEQLKAYPETSMRLIRETESKNKNLMITGGTGTSGKAMRNISPRLTSRKSASSPATRKNRTTCGTSTRLPVRTSRSRLDSIEFEWVK